MTEIDELKNRIKQLEAFVGFREIPTYVDPLGVETPVLDRYPMSGYDGRHQFGQSGNTSFLPRRGYSQDIMDYRRAHAYGMGRDHKEYYKLPRQEMVYPELQPYYDKGYDDGERGES